MAKAQFTKYFTEDEASQFSSSGIVSVNKSGTKASVMTFGDIVVHLEGHGLTAGFGGFGLSAGRIDKATIQTSDHHTLFTVVEDHPIKAVNYGNADGGGMDAVLGSLLAGNDKIVGSGASDEFLFGYAGNDTISGKAGDDRLYGGAGKDILTGGKGQDTFLYYVGMGHDVVTDFDADGSDGRQDHLHFYEYTPYEIHQDKHGDAVIWINNKDTLTLKGVAFDQVDVTDFV